MTKCSNKIHYKTNRCREKKITTIKVTFFINKMEDSKLTRFPFKVSEEEES